MTDRTEVLHLKTVTFLLMNSKVRNYFQCKFLGVHVNRILSPTMGIVFSSLRHLAFILSIHISGDVLR